MPPEKTGPLSGEVQQWVRGRWVTVRLGNVRVTDRRRVFDGPKPARKADDAT